MTLSGTDLGHGHLNDTLENLSEGQGRPGMTFCPPLSVAAPTAVVIRIADSIGVDPRSLASAIDPDTLRRTRYPVIEEQTEGRFIWRHPGQ
jgi:hypothetical protein